MLAPLPFPLAGGRFAGGAGATAVAEEADATAGAALGEAGVGAGEAGVASAPPRLFWMIWRTELAAVTGTELDATRLVTPMEESISNMSLGETANSFAKS